MDDTTRQFYENTDSRLVMRTSITDLVRVGDSVITLASRSSPVRRYQSNPNTLVKRSMALGLNSEP